MDKRRLDKSSEAVCSSLSSSFTYFDPLYRYYVDSPCVVVRGKPSASMATKLEKGEKARIEAQKERLGPDGLAKAEKELEEAKKEHDVEIPSEILRGFPVPDVKSIAWIPVQSLQEAGVGRTSRLGQTGNAPLSRHIESDGSKLPFFVQYDHVQVRVYNHLCLSMF